MLVGYVETSRVLFCCISGNIFVNEPVEQLKVVNVPSEIFYGADY